MGSVEAALIQYAARHLRYTDVIRFLEEAKDRKDLAERMKLITNIRPSLYEDKVLWPPEQRDWMWKEILAANFYAWQKLPGKEGIYEFGDNDRKALRQSIENLVFSGDLAGGKDSLEAYVRLFGEDPWAKVQKAKMQLGG